MLCPHCQAAVGFLPALAGHTVACSQCGGRFVMPAEAFDPYYTWLGIPPSEQPPDHYRLLGLQRFEANPTVIENAADRQMRHLHSMRTGAHAAESQQLLNEVAAARVSLLDPTAKAAYDRQLPKPAASPPAASTFAHAPPPASSFPQSPPPPRIQPARKTNTKAIARVISVVFIVLGGFVGLGIGVLAVFYLTGQDFLGLSGRLRTNSNTVTKSRSMEKAPTPAASSKSIDDLQELFAKKSPSVPEPVRPQSTDAASPSPPIAQRPKQPPAPKPAAAPRAPKALPPLANVPTSRGLPDLTSPQPSLLFELAAEPMGPLEFALHSEAANLPPGARLLLEPDATASRWTIHCVGGEGKPIEDNLATISRDGRELSLAWKEPLADSAVRRQLANCLLEVKLGPESRVLQLRDPIRDPALLLNLEVDKQMREYDLVDPPLPQKLYLKIIELQDFARPAKLRGQADTVPLAKPAIIEFEGLRGAEIEVRLFRNSTTRKFEIRSEPIFRERGEREFELTRKRLDALENATQAALGKLQAELSTLNSAVASARATLQNLNANAPSNFYEAKQRNDQAKSLGLSIDKALTRIDDLQRQLPRHQARLAAVPGVRDFINSLHERAAIHFVVGAPCGNHQLILVDAQKPPALAGAQ